MKLNLAEHPFVGIQGEGPKAGIRSYFLRFFGHALASNDRVLQVGSGIAIHA